MFSIYIHSDFVFRGTEKECDKYFDNFIRGTFNEIFCEIIEDCK